MNKKFIKIGYQVILFISLIIIGYQISGNYDYEIADGGFLFGVSLALVLSFIWKKINIKYFK